MKIILSRKGFDAEYGGVPSPIMPDGTLVSLPIPCRFDEPYENLQYRNRTFWDIVNELNAKELDGNCGHVDPDLRPIFHSELPIGWCPIFGQCGAAAGHLENQGVSIGDLFLFFGWFRKTEEYDERLRYVRNTMGVHMLFGYLQIGMIVKGEGVREYFWHPHSYRTDKNNTMYIASHQLIINGIDTGLPGAGTFKYSDDLVLTMPGMSKSRWKLPDCFREVSISYHSMNSWKKEGYFQSVAKGQEFVVAEDERITQWARSIICNNSAL